MKKICSTCGYKTKTCPVMKYLRTGVGAFIGMIVLLEAKQSCKSWKDKNKKCIGCGKIRKLEGGLCRKCEDRL